MSTDPVVAFLAKQSRNRLREMQGEIREQIASLKSQDEMVARALAEKGELANAPNEAASPKPAAPGNKRALYLDIMATRPDHAWLPAEIRERLASLGMESNSPAIRVMLRR